MVWNVLYKGAPQSGHSRLFDESPMGVKAARSGKMAQNIVANQSIPPW